MFETIEISPAIAQLVKQNCQRHQLPLEPQLAKNVVEEAIMEQDPEASLIVDAGLALSDIPYLARTLGINDVVVNGKHIHISLLESDHKVRVPRTLVGTRYLEHGSLVVKLNRAVSGVIVGHINNDGWNACADNASSNGEVELDFKLDDKFDFAAFLKSIASQNGEMSMSRENIKAEEYLEFLKDRAKLSSEKQKQIISALLVPSIRENFSLIASSEEDQVYDILHDAAIWNARVEKLCERLTTKFNSLSSAKVRQVILEVGEKLGGQVELPEFQKALLAELTKEVVSGKLSSQARAQIRGLIDQVYSGASVLSAVKQFVKNQFTVDLAQAINEQRQGLINFANATAEEFGFAYKTLALQPAYATHSQKESVDLEAVNEALILLEAAKLAEEMKGLELNV